MEVQKLLQTAASATVDAGVRADAGRQLQQAAAEHFDAYMVTLAQTLAAEGGTPVEARMLAALAMKNELTAKNERDRAAKARRWAEGPLAREAKQQIKATALGSLADANNGVASSAAQLVASIATLELPRGEWPELTGQLVTMTHHDQPANVKRAALTSIGYICETANPADRGLGEQMNGFLTAIIQAAQPSEPDEGVRLVAINALANSLEFIRSNFEREGERNLIMSAVCEATQNTGEELQSAAFACLAKIMHHYYEFMEPYMAQALFSLTIGGMQSQYDGVQCMAIEFWSTISEAEYDMQMEEAEEEDDADAAEEQPPRPLMGGSAAPPPSSSTNTASGTGSGAAAGAAASAAAAGAGAGQPQQPQQRSFHFVSKALSQVLPPLLQLLVKEDEEQAEDDWNVVMAAGTCVELMAKAAGDPVLDIIMAFVGPNIQSAKWQERDAAVQAFGAALGGPDRGKLLQIVQGALQPLASMITDPSRCVRETVAWCLGRIADYVIAALDSPEQLHYLLGAVIAGLKDDPRVVTHSCWAIMNLSEQLNPLPGQGDTSPLSPFYELIVGSLIKASDRGDNEHSARTSAYEALSSLVIYSPNDTLPLIMSCSSVCDQRMRQSLQMQAQVVSIDDRQNVEELQINLLGWLTSIIRRVENQVQPVADSIMGLLGQFLESKFPNSLVEDDIFIAIGAVAGSAGPAFAKYVPALLPYILAALKETDMSVSSTAVGLITDITHALGDAMSPEWTAGFMHELSLILAQFDVMRPELVPPALACIGDLASASGAKGHFDMFLGPTEEFLGQIAGTVVFIPEASVDHQIHVTNVKQAILDAQVGIVAGYRDAPQKLEPYVFGIFAFIQALCQDSVMMQLVTDVTIRTIVGLVGDLGAMYPNKQFQSVFQQPWVNDIITRALRSDESPSTKETAVYAQHEQKLQLA